MPSLTLGEELADADNRDDAGCEGRESLLVHIGIGLAEDVPAALDYLESELPPEGFLFGSLGVADISIASFFVNGRHVGFEVDAHRWPKVARFVDTVLDQPTMAKLLGFEAIQLNASIKGRRQALADAGVKLTAQSWGVREPRRGMMTL